MVLPEVRQREKQWYLYMWDVLILMMVKTAHMMKVARERLKHGHTPIWSHTHLV